MKKYNEIIKHYESCLEKHGDSHLGVDWPNEDDVSKRYKIMLEIIALKKEIGKVSLLDFGCGTAHLLDYILKNDFDSIEYSGFDISEKFISVCEDKFRNTKFYCGDILNPKFELPNFDYFIMNGVFTEKRGLTFEEMWDYFSEILKKVFSIANKGVAFNVMSKQVDWERDDLFHVPLDKLADFLCKNLSRNYVIRNDYGLYEYALYLYK